MHNPYSATEAVVRAFGTVRAEYLDEKLFQLFAEPAYWPEIHTLRPSVLVGGRGTGKTTALRGMSYPGQRQLEGRIDDWNHIGLYWRFDTNVVSAFQGGGLTDQRWAQMFGHYVNLVFVHLIIDFLEWRARDSPDSPEVQPTQLRGAFRTLGLDAPNSLTEARAHLDDALTDFELDINNISNPEAQTSRLSVQGIPPMTLARSLKQLPDLTGKPFYFLLDEFENLTDLQQRCINTLVRHSGQDGVTFKIGVKDLGHRDLRTLNEGELLEEPADYASINIAERLSESKLFSSFAQKICENRLAQLNIEGVQIRDLLPAPGFDEEAELLLSGAARARLLAGLHNKSEIQTFTRLRASEQALLGYWSDATGEGLSELLQDWADKPGLWRGRMTNHGHAMLFATRRRLPGTRKLYAGFDTMVTISAGNVRFLLELVGSSLRVHTANGFELGKAVSYSDQTKAAQDVGATIVRQMPGFGPEGRRITQLVLGLGRVFNVMAANPESHSPEVNQFRVSDQPSDRLRSTLESGVMHLALDRFQSNKNSREGVATRSWDYRLHPILSPFFEFSSRKKRRLTTTERQLEMLISDPPRGIRAILADSGRSSSTEIPEQLTLFGAYYDGS